MITVEGLHLAYGDVEAVHGISFEVHAGEVVALLGANGAGKSTTMRGISGLLRPRSGRVLLDGEDITMLGAHDIVGRGLRHVPEGRRIFGTMTVHENLLMGGYSLRRHGSQLRRRISAVFEKFPVLEQRRGQLAGTLSGGEQQMLAVGRALITEPRVLALDEPSLGLSPRMAHEILTTVGSLAEDGTAVLLVEQNVAGALGVAHTAHVMELGSIVLSGPAAELATDDRITQTYLGGSVDQEATDGQH